MRAMQRLAAIGASTAFVGASVLAGGGVASASTGPSHAAGCASGAVPVQIVGAPGVKAHATLGVYLWHSKSGYSLRVTHPGHQQVVFSGSITVSRSIRDVHRVTLERADKVSVGPHRHTLNFRFTNYGGIDGVNFGSDCSKTVKVTLHIGTVAAAPVQVFLGKAKTHPTSVPFTIERSKPA